MSNFYLLKANLHDVKINHKDIYSQLKRKCLIDGFGKDVLNSKSTKLYEIYILLNQEHRVLSWSMIYSLEGKEKLVMLWTSYRERRKGYCSFILKQIGEDFGVENISAYGAAEKAMRRAYNNSYKTLYDEEYAPHIQFENLEFRNLEHKSFECKNSEYENSKYECTTSLV